MGVSIKFRRGTADEHNTFTGSEGEITVLKADTAGDPWKLLVHDGSNSYEVPTVTSADVLTNKTLTNGKMAGTISDTSSNTLATVTTGKLTFESGAVVLDNALAIDQTKEKTLEAMIARVARKHQMILGD